MKKVECHKEILDNHLHELLRHLLPFYHLTIVGHCKGQWIVNKALMQTPLARHFKGVSQRPDPLSSKILRFDGLQVIVDSIFILGLAVVAGEHLQCDVSVATGTIESMLYSKIEECEGRTTSDPGKAKL